MKKINPFKGLRAAYYFRHLFFASLIFGLMLFVVLQSDRVNYGAIALIALNTLLYPYAMFAYESIVGFLLGDNDYYVAITPLYMVYKYFVVTICWTFAIFIAPIGLLIIYFYQLSNARKKVK